MSEVKGRIGITCYHTFGGSGVLATELGLALAARGWEVHFVSSRTPSRLSGYHERVFMHEVEPMHYPLFEFTPFALALAVKQAEVARAFDLDLLHVHYAIPHATSAWLARQMLENRRDGARSFKIITTLHGTDITLVGRDPSYFDVTCFSLERSDGITAVSDYLAALTVETFDIELPIRRIHNFVDTDAYFPLVEGPCREDLGLGEGPLLLHISNFRDVKRIPDLMRIFLRVSRETPAHLMLLGEGPELARALDFARTEGIRDRVHALGRQEDPACFLAMADVLLLPSASESFGLVALEALSCGTPVVASRIGGLPEVVRHGHDGFLEEVGDAEAMAARTLELLGDPVMRAEFGKNGRQRAISEFSRDRIVDEYEAYYEEVLASGNAGV
ncbi:N-acetyl-alpha-D-glucosaminyl L-malate synthase BshA [Gemmatimonadota bacterium]